MYEDLSGIGEIPDFERIWFRSICAPDELDMVLNPKSACDELLRMKAEAIADNPRLHRVKIAKARSLGWSGLLVKENTDDFEEYINSLPEYEKMMSASVPFDYLLAPSSDSMCVKTPNGNVVIISEAFRYFLYYMNLGVLDISGIPDSVRIHSLIIAVRTLLLSESLDFYLDPRGIVPENIDLRIKYAVKWQLKFIIGHEFAHNYLHHIGSALPGYKYSRGLAMNRVAASEWAIQAHKWEQEYEADRSSISVPMLDEGARAELCHNALRLLSYVHLFELVADHLDPDLSSIKSHPPTDQRYKELMSFIKKSFGVSPEGKEENIRNVELLANHIIKIADGKPDLLKFYGSVYLAEWRGKARLDRVDY